MSATPAFAASDVIASAAIAATANTNHDGTGTLSTLFTGTNGQSQRINAINIAASAAAAVTTQGKIRFFISTDGGVTKRKLGELNVTPLTPSATISGFVDTFYPFMPIPVLDANTIIYASTNQAEAFAATLIGVKF
jgi:hypothetical protein